MQPEPQLLEALGEAAERETGSFKPQGVANSLWVYATLGVQPEPPLLEALLQRAASLRVADGLEPEEYRQLFQASLEGTLPLARLSLAVAAAAEQAWRSAAAETRSSELHKDVVQELQRLGVQCEMEHLTADGL